MACRVIHQVWGPTTDHTDEIALLHGRAGTTRDPIEQMTIRLAAELLEAHDDTGVSLDHWETARDFVEHHLGRPILLRYGNQPVDSPGSAPD